MNLKSNAMQTSPKITLTSVVIKDETTNGYTGYFLEVPEVIAEGNSRDEVDQILFENLQTVLQFRREDYENELKADGNYSTKSFELELA